VVAREVVVRRNVGASGQGLSGCGVIDPVEEPRLKSHTLHRGRWRCSVKGCVASCRGARGPTSFRSRPA
jgi:hypothetical protein